MARADPRAAEGEDEEDGNEEDHLSQYSDSDESDYAPPKAGDSDSASAEDDLPPEEGLEATRRQAAKPIVAGPRTAAPMKTPASYSLSLSASSSSASSSSSSTCSSSKAFPSMGWNLPVQESLTSKVLSANSVANGKATSK